MSDDEEQVPFARTPGDINRGSYLDYTTRTGLAVYQQSIAPLYRSEDQYFDLHADGLTHFMNELNNRATAYGWNEDVLLIEVDPNQIAGSGTYFIDSHGTFTLNHIQQVE